MADFSALQTYYCECHILPTNATLGDIDTWSEQLDKATNTEQGDLKRHTVQIGPPLSNEKSPGQAESDNFGKRKVRVGNS